MQHILEKVTGKHVSVFEDGQRYVVRYSNEYPSFAKRGLTSKKKRLIIALRILSAIASLVFFAVGLSRIPDPFRVIPIGMMALMSGLFFVMLDYVVYFVSKIIARRKYSYDLVFDTQDKSITFDGDAIIAWTYRLSLSGVLFEMNDREFYKGDQTVKLLENSVFTIKDGRPLIELRSGLSQANVDFSLLVFDEEAIISLVAALNKVRELTMAVSQKSPSLVHTQTVASTRAKNDDDGDEINPMD